MLEMRLRKLYMAFMKSRNLLLFNVGVSTGLSAAGDVIQQKYFMSMKENDRVRTRNMAASGFVLGVSCHYWYIYLDDVIPGTSLRAVLRKVLIDQLLASPVFISIFFITVGFLEGASVRCIGSDIVNKGWRVYAAEWMIWPPAQLINFHLVPLNFRVLYDNLVSLGFDIYSSYVKHDMELSDCSEPQKQSKTVSKSKSK